MRGECPLPLDQIGACPSLPQPLHSHPRPGHGLAELTVYPRAPATSRKKNQQSPSSEWGYRLEEHFGAAIRGGAGGVILLKPSQQPHLAALPAWEAGPWG